MISKAGWENSGHVIKLYLLKSNVQCALKGNNNWENDETKGYDWEEKFGANLALT